MDESTKDLIDMLSFAVTCLESEGCANRAALCRDAIAEIERLQAIVDAMPGYHERPTVPGIYIAADKSGVNHLMTLGPHLIAVWDEYTSRFTSVYGPIPPKGTE